MWKVSNKFWNCNKNCKNQMKNRCAKFVLQEKQMLYL